VRESFRGRGPGRILDALESIARGIIGFGWRLASARRRSLYQSAGYVPIETYGEHLGNELSRCFEKGL
jgi:hypothetical protein